MTQQTVPTIDINRDEKPAVIRDFLDNYSDALAAAQRAAYTTSTTGWLDMYSEHVKAEHKARREHHFALSNQLELLKSRQWNEDNLKAAKDTIKEISEAIDAESHWQNQTVRPLTAPVRLCQELIDEVRRLVANIASTQPLVYASLGDKLEAELSTQLQPKFCEETGAIIIRLGGGVIAD